MHFLSTKIRWDCTFLEKMCYKQVFIKVHIRFFAPLSTQFSHCAVFLTEGLTLTDTSYWYYPQNFWQNETHTALQLQILLRNGPPKLWKFWRIFLFLETEFWNAIFSKSGFWKSQLRMATSWQVLKMKNWKMARVVKNFIYK